MSDYTLSAKITADTSDFETGVDEAKDSLGELGAKCEEAGGKAGSSGGLLSKLKAKITGVGDGARGASGHTSKFGEAMKALGSVGMGVGMQLGQRVLSAIADLGGEMVEASDSADKFASTLSFAGIDDSAIKRLTASTQEYADKTVYGLSDVRNITAQLAANGVADYDRLAQAAGNLNAVAGGNAETFKSVGMVMTQTAGAGKLTTENWNQLADAIPGASGKLQEAMKANGAYTGDFREAMANGEITAEEFNRAIMDLGFTDAAQEAATSTSTIEGAMGNLAASVVGVGSQVISAIKPALTGGMTAVAGFVSNFGTAFGVVGDYVTNFGTKFAEINVEMGGMATVGDVVACAIQEMGGAFGLTAEQTAPFANMMASLVDTFAPIVEQVQAQLMPALSTLGGAIMNLAGAVMPLVMAAIQALAPVVASAISAIISVATTIAQTLAPVIEGIAGTIQAVLPVAQAAFEVFGSAVKGVIDAVFPFIQSLIENVMNVINGIISTVLAAINGDWGAVWNGIKGVAQSIWDGIGNIINAGINMAKGVIESVLGAIKGIWDGAWNALKGFCADIWEGIKSGVSNGIQGVMNFIGELPGKITGFFAGAGSWLVDSGKAMLDGLRRGIENGISGAINAVKNGLSKIRSFFPFSPAKRGPFSGHGYTTYSGKALMGDFARSISGASSLAVKAADSALGGVQQTFTTYGTVAASPVSVESAPAQGQDVGTAFLSALRAVGGFRLDMDADGMAATLAPAMDRQLGYRTEMGYA